MPIRLYLEKLFNWRSKNILLIMAQVRLTYSDFTFYKYCLGRILDFQLQKRQIFQMIFLLYYILYKLEISHCTYKYAKHINWFVYYCKLINLSERVREGGRNRKEERLYILYDIPQMTATARSGPGYIQKWRAVLLSPRLSHRIRNTWLGCLPACWQGAEMELQWLEIVPVCIASSLIYRCRMSDFNILRIKT